MAKEGKKGLFGEFKEFIAKGSFIDMAVGIVVGGAFTNIVNTLVSSVITPCLNALIFVLTGGNADTFSGLDITLVPAQVDEAGVVVREAYVLGLSAFISAILSFLLMAFVLFMLLKIINKIRSESEKVKEKLHKKPCEEVEEVKEEK